MKRILILGSEGFIGSSLSNYFLKRGWDVTGADQKKTSRNYPFILTNTFQTDYDHLFQNRNFDFLINAAGSGSVHQSNIDPVQDFRANTLDTMMILESVRKKNPDCIYLHISSAAVYGNPVKLPIGENAETIPVSPYGWHKLAAEKLCEEYANLYGIKILIARPFSVFGPGLRKQLFWEVHQKLLNNPGALELSGTGHESRDFIYIDDLVYCFHLMLEKGDFKAGIYNLASGIETPIHSAVSSFLTHFHPSVELVFNNQVRQGDPLNWRADITKIRQLGFENPVDFTTGIAETAHWLLKEFKS